MHNILKLQAHAPPQTASDALRDANQYALSYARHFRALHQLNHDHDCTTTCIKYVAKQCRHEAQDALRKGKVVACRFWLFHILVFTYVAFSKPSPNASGGEGRSSWRHPTLPSPTSAMSFASQSCEEIRLFDQHRQMWAKFGPVATSTSSSCPGP